MLKAIGYTLLTLAFGLMVAGAAVAETKKPPGKRDSDERRYFCGNQHIQCEADCDKEWGDYPNVFLPTCKEACADEAAECLKAERTYRLQSNMFDVLQSPGMLGEAGSGSITTPVGGLNANEVERACTRVHGLYGRTTNGFGCINASCDDKGSCFLVCYGGNCLAITPSKLPDSVTLLGILQGGNNVGRGGTGGGGSLSGTEGGTGGTAKAPVIIP